MKLLPAAATAVQKARNQRRAKVAKAKVKVVNPTAITATRTLATNTTGNSLL